MNAHALQSFLSSVPVGWFALIIAGIVIIFDAMRSGSNRAAVFSLAFPFALTVYSLLHSAVLIGPIIAGGSTSLQAIIFLASAVASYLIIDRILMSFGGFPNGFITALFAAVAVIIVTLAVWAQAPGLSSFWYFGSGTAAAFSAAYRLWWLLAAYIALIFSRA